MQDTKDTKNTKDTKPQAPAAGERPQGYTVGKDAGRKGLPTPAWLATCAVMLVAGLLVGHFVIGGGPVVSLDGKTSLTEQELDSNIASYTLDGQVHNMTAREVIEGTTSLKAMANEDGTYKIPAPTYVLMYAQNKILLDDAKSRNLSVSDEELASFTQSVYGTSDYAAIAQQYQISEDEAKKTLTDSALVGKLRDSVVTTALPDQPEAPAQPADPSNDVPTEAYATYVIGLLGDEWDSANNTWARTDGDYYAVLSGYEISNSGATYAAAQAAFNVANSKYAQAYQQVGQEWTDYVNNQLMSKASIQIGSLVSAI